MGDGHFHHDAVSVAWITLSAIVGINVLRLFAAWLLNRGRLAGTAGQAIGSLTTFSGG